MKLYSLFTSYTGIASLTVASLALLCPSAALGAEDVVLVANPSVSASDVSIDDMKLVFLGTKNSIGGSGVEPVTVEKGSVHESFLKKFVGKSDTAYRMHLKSLVFAGKASMPKSLSDDAAVVQYVAKTKGAIGYVSPTAITSGVKKLDVK